MRVEDHPENALPLRSSRINDPYAPPDPSQAIQGPLAPNANAF